jgi:predicted glycosyltransferase
MSHTDRVLNKLHYIGPLSRFAECQFPILEFTHDKKSLPTILAMISGPEPTRTCFEEILLKQLESYKGKSIVLQGLPANYREQIIGNCTIYNHLPDSQLLALLPEIDLVIARSGYSTIMDLIFWQKKAVFVPTPGQTEQLYLAQKLVGEGQFYSQQQMDFDLQDCLAHYEEYSGFVAMERPTFELMESALQLLLNDFNG